MIRLEMCPLTALGPASSPHTAQSNRAALAAAGPGTLHLHPSSRGPEKKHPVPPRKHYYSDGPPRQEADRRWHAREQGVARPTRQAGPPRTARLQGRSGTCLPLRAGRVGGGFGVGWGSLPGGRGAPQGGPAPALDQPFQVGLAIADGAAAQQLDDGHLTARGPGAQGGHLNPEVQGSGVSGQQAIRLRRRMGCSGGHGAVVVLLRVVQLGPGGSHN